MAIAPDDPRVVAALQGVVDKLTDLCERLEARAGRVAGELTCIECGARSAAPAAGWKAYLTDDDQVAFYCRDCATAEFDDA